MLRPPSNQKTYTLFYSRDPAIVQLAKDATPEQTAEHERLLRVARETGDVTPVLVPGDQPTKFTMRQLPAEACSELMQMTTDGVSHVRVCVLAFRVALVDVGPLPGGVKLEHEIHPTFGRIATTAFLDQAGCSGAEGASLLVELGTLVITRARADNPF